MRRLADHAPRRWSTTTTLTDQAGGLTRQVQHRRAVVAGSVGKVAYAFALLGKPTMAGLSATLPSCTGARHASVLGSIAPGRGGLPARPDGVLLLTTLQLVPSASTPKERR